MNPKFISFATLTIFLILLISACAPTQPPVPTAVILNTSVPTKPVIPTQLPTDTPTPAPTQTLVPTETAVPVCKPDNTVSGSIKNDIPDYLNILSVTTKLKGTNLTAVFSLRGIPDQITINKNSLKKGIPEIAWGVGIDTDNKDDTGGKAFVTSSGYGFDYILQAFNFKNRTEQKGSILNLFRGNTLVWKVKNDGSINSVGTGKIDVDPTAKTITLSANISGIKPDSYLYFYTYVQDNDTLIDEICSR